MFGSQGAADAACPTVRSFRLFSLSHVSEALQRSRSHTVVRHASFDFHLDALHACRVNITAWKKDRGSSGFEHNWLMFAAVLSLICLPMSVDSLLRMKEEAAEVDEFTFSQGTSDQESNGSGSYYIKQEP